MYTYSKIFLTIILFMGFLAGCKEKEDPNPGAGIEAQVDVTINPGVYAPLTARLAVSLSEEASVTLRVVGKNGPASDVVKQFKEVAKEHALDVLGLYASHENEVELTFLDRSGNEIGNKMVMIQTSSLLNDLPRIRINSANVEMIKPGFSLVNYFGYDQRVFPQRAFMFDAFGDIRWFLNFNGHPSLNNLFFDVGMIRSQNGNLLFGDVVSDAVYEINMLGEILQTWDLRGKGLGFHHAVFEKPNGNILATVNDNSRSTVEDLIVEVDRSTGGIIKRWDLRQSLDRSRRAWSTDLADINIDWFHANGIAFDTQDNGIIVSGRTQGTVKLSENNQVVWILAPHRDWSIAGNGDSLNKYLLQPLDAQGLPIDDQRVLSGEIDHPDFAWAWYQHAPLLLPNGNLLLFDNGDNRNYSYTAFSGIDVYSRAVEYKIDEQNMTIQQVWEYGEEERTEAFSRIVSGVDYFELEDNVLFAPGAVVFSGTNYGKVFEIDRQTNQVLFEATITPPKSNFNITFHSIKRMSIYPN